MELQPGSPLTRLMRLIAGLRPWHVWLAVLFALVFAIHVSPPEFRYDERYYMESAYFLLQNGDVIAVLKTPLDLAAGPLYATVHALASPITALQAHGIRYSYTTRDTPFTGEHFRIATNTTAEQPFETHKRLI